MVRGILFDLDGTLFDRDGAVHDLLRDQHRRHSALLAGIPGEQYVARLLELDAHGYGDKTLAYQRAAFEFSFSSATAGLLTADFWRAYHDHCRAFPDALPTLRELRARGLKLGVVTNGAIATQEPVIQRLGMDDLVDAVLISEREGVRKPDADIFLRAVRALRLEPNEAWYVGDHPEVDVRGATNAGLAAIWRRTPHWPEPDVPHRTLEHLDELLPWIQAAERP